MGGKSSKQKILEEELHREFYDEENVLFGEKDQVKGFAKLITAEINKQAAIEKDDFDHNKENMQLLKYMYKKMDPAVMATATYKNHGDIQLSFKYEATKEILLVKVIRCRDLQAKDLRGKTANAYVKLILYAPGSEDVTKKTQVAKYTLNPEFHEIFTFSLTDDLLPSGQVIAQVWDSDMVVNEDFVGESIIKLSSFDFHLDPVHTAWYNLKAETDLHITGELDVELRYQLPQTLLVTVHAASNITNRHDEGLPNPFVKLQIPGIAKCYDTEVKPNTVNPDWSDQTFEFELPQEELCFRYVVLHLIDKGKRKDSNDSLGQVIVDLCNFEPEIGFRGSIALADLKNTDRLRMRWFQQATVQEFRESLIAHAAFRYPKSMFQRAENTKVLKMTARKQGQNLNIARLRIIKGIPVY